MFPEYLLEFQIFCGTLLYSIRRIEPTFAALCTTSLDKRNFPEIDKYFQKLDNAISLSNDKFDIDLEYLGGLYEELDNTLGDRNTNRNRSPFGIYFQSEPNKCSQYIT